jgi:hypothetical protein
VEEQGSDLCLFGGVHRLSQDQLEIGRIVPLAELSDTASLLRSVEFQLSKVRLGPEYGTTFDSMLLDSIHTHLDKLHRTLIEPIRKRMNAGHLVIAPHGILHRLPFRALFNGREYLIGEFTIYYAPSARIYARCRFRSNTEEF